MTSLSQPPFHTPIADASGRVLPPWVLWLNLITGTARNSALPTTLTGDVAGTGTTTIPTVLSASGVVAGTYTKLTVDAKGRATLGASATTSDIAEGANLYYTDARVYAAGDPRYAPIAKGVTNGDSHDHSGGDGAQIAHSGLSGLTGDDHSQYLYLNGRSGGQTIYGGTAAGENLTLSSTFHATKGKIFFGANSVYDGANNRLGINTTSPSSAISLGGNTARTIWMERHTTANTAGTGLVIRSGGATVGATDKNGGTLTLGPGASTGTGESGVIIQGCVAGGAGTADNSFATQFHVLGNKIGFYGATPIAQPTVTGSRGGNVALASLLTQLASLGLITDSTTA